jgi:hypothetical protein
LKKVHEGVQIFEDMYDKFMMSTNATQKDKLETDLKTQIKKLQRMRDQVKSWQTSNDIKDKQPLDQTRRVIETVSPRSEPRSEATRRVTRGARATKGGENTLELKRESEAPQARIFERAVRRARIPTGDRRERASPVSSSEARIGGAAGENSSSAARTPAPQARKPRASRRARENTHGRPKGASLPCLVERSEDRRRWRRGFPEAVVGRRDHFFWRIKRE